MTCMAAQDDDTHAKEQQSSRLYIAIQPNKRLCMSEPHCAYAHSNSHSEKIAIWVASGIRARVIMHALRLRMQMIKVIPDSVLIDAMTRLPFPADQSRGALMHS